MSKQDQAPSVKNDSNKTLINSKNSKDQKREKYLNISMNPSITKLEFTMILLQDVGLTSIYQITCILLGANKINNGNTVRENVHHGIIIFCLLWIPGVIMILHELYYDSILTRSSTIGMRILAITMGMIFYPTLPVFLYLSFLYKPKEMEYIQRLRIVQNFNLHLHSSMHLILLIVLLLQDQLSEDTACLVDSLGRSACLAVPVLLNIVLTVIMQVTSSLNLQTESKRAISAVINCSLYTTPTIIFRIFSFALIITYIDMWAVIPICSIIFLHILLQGYNSNYMKDNSETQNQEAEDVDGMHNYQHNYALIWSGSEWTCEPNNFEKLDADTIYESEMKNISPILLGIQSSIIYVHRYHDDISWSLLCCYFGNGLILINLSVIYVLVNYVETFNYTSNILSNELFNFLFILLCLYAILSPLLLLITKYSFISLRKSILSLFMLCIVLMFPYFCWIIMKTTLIVNTVYFFTINSNQNTSIVTSHTVFPGENMMFNEKYGISEIYFDINCTEKELNAKLLFVNRSSPACKIVIENTEGFIFSVEYQNLYRSSSPLFSNRIKLKGFIALRQNVLKIGTMYVNDKVPDINNVKAYFTCSSDSSIELIEDIKDVKNITCSNKKFMTRSGLIFENRCVEIDGLHFKKQVPCKTLLDPKFYLNGESLNQFSIISENGKSNFVCCINSTHSLKKFGHCESQTFNDWKFQIPDYKLDECNDYQEQNMISYILHDNCLLSIFYKVYCEEKENPIKKPCKTVYCY